MLLLLLLAHVLLLLHLLLLLHGHHLLVADLLLSVWHRTSNRSARKLSVRLSTAHGLLLHSSRVLLLHKRRPHSSGTATLDLLGLWPLWLLLLDGEIGAASLVKVLLLAHHALRLRLLLDDRLLPATAAALKVVEILVLLPAVHVGESSALRHGNLLLSL